MLNWRSCPFDEEDSMVRSHTRSIEGEEGCSVLERLWERPAVRVISLAAGPRRGGPGSRAVHGGR
ncbi:hypothetical protein ACFUCV_01800 [Specibacter sp. NPDC057265]|uniref:hypothetical protein n=1 Tax=Specibacter sp. NPDC057265 TaxID=3346075 RepID=UPI003644722F